MEGKRFLLVLILTVVVSAAGCSMNNPFAQIDQKAAPADNQAPSLAEAPVVDETYPAQANGHPSGGPEVLETQVREYLQQLPAEQAHVAMLPASDEQTPPPESFASFAEAHMDTPSPAHSPDEEYQPPNDEPTESRMPYADTPAVPVVEAVYVKSLETPEISEPPTDSTVNQPLMTSPSRSNVSSVNDRIARLESITAKTPNDVESQWQLRLLYLVEGMDEQALTVPPELDSEAGKLIGHTMRALLALKHASRDPVAAADDALQAVESLRDVVAMHAELQIPSVQFCSKVTSYGVYEPMEATFSQGRANRTIVYCELKNFTSSPDGEFFRTNLAQQIEIFDASGQSLWAKINDEIEDLSRKPRNDFFLAQVIQLPTSLEAGDYILKITVTDKASAKASQAIKPFTILRAS